MDSSFTLPCLSVITVCLNAEDTLLRTLDSVVSQSYPNIEYILCDGGSTDQTEIIFSTWLAANNQNNGSNTISVRWVRQESDGIYAAMNEAAAMATGEVITFLHANDVFGSVGVCYHAMNALNHDFKISAVFGDVTVLSDVWWQRRIISAKWWRPWMLNWGFMAPQPGFFIRSQAFYQTGPLLETMQIGADFEWLLRFTLSGFYAKWVSGIRVKMDYGGISMRGALSRKIITHEMLIGLRCHGKTVGRYRLLLRLPIKTFGILRAMRR